MYRIEGGPWISFICHLDIKSYPLSFILKHMGIKVYELLVEPESYGGLREDSFHEMGSMLH
jgi:hypothetical protein